MDPAFTAIIKQDGIWWIGWVEEFPGVNSQGESREELVGNLSAALQEALELRTGGSLSAGRFSYEKIRLTI